MKQEKCHDCQVSPGEIHKDNCDVERCPLCGYQMITCGCDLTHVSDEDRIKWTGEWPGAAECREFDLWSKFTDQGWVPCDKREPGATEDLNTLVSSPDYEWNKDKKRWIKKDET